MDTPHFEPPLDPSSVVGPAEYTLHNDPVEESYMRALQPFTDLQLLLELRRRKRLGRVVATTIIPGYTLERGNDVPVEYQMHQTFKQAAHNAAEAWLKGTVPTGAKIERGHFEDRPRGHEALDRRVLLPLNYVIGSL